MAKNVPGGLVKKTDIDNMAAPGMDPSYETALLPVLQDAAAPAGGGRLQTDLSGKKKGTHCYYTSAENFNI